MFRKAANSNWLQIYDFFGNIARNWRKIDITELSQNHEGREESAKVTQRTSYEHVLGVALADYSISILHQPARRENHKSFWLPKNTSIGQFRRKAFSVGL